VLLDCCLPNLRAGAFDFAVHVEKGKSALLLPARRCLLALRCHRVSTNQQLRCLPSALTAPITFA